MVCQSWTFSEIRGVTELFQDSIDSQMKTLTRTLLGVNVKQAKPISGEKRFCGRGDCWVKMTLPRWLTRQFIYLASTFRFEVHGEEHRELRFSQLEVIEGDLVERIKSRLLRKRIMQEHDSIANSRQTLSSIMRTL